jgi:hypothetical protein
MILTREISINLSSSYEEREDHTCAMKRKEGGLPRNEVALTFHSINDVIRVKDFSYLDFDYVYVGERTLVVPADTVERYRRLQPEVSEVLTAEELPVAEKTTRSREQIIFEASAVS